MTRSGLEDSIMNYRSKYTTISSNASTRLLNSLKRMGIETTTDILNMTDEQVNSFKGFSQRKLLRLYRSYLMK